MFINYENGHFNLLLASGTYPDPNNIKKMKGSGYVSDARSR